MRKYGGSPVDEGLWLVSDFLKVSTLTCCIWLYLLSSYLKGRPCSGCLLDLSNHFRTFRLGALFDILHSSDVWPMLDWSG